jgi:hypothetical protein
MPCAHANVLCVPEDADWIQVHAAHIPPGFPVLVLLT